MKPRDLPIFYYHDHFMEMLASVEQIYGSALDQEHLAFINEFRLLTKDEQCLYIRINNRKGIFFDKNGFKYDEIVSVDRAIEGLIQKQFIRKIEPQDYTAWLKNLRKLELHEIGVSGNSDLIKPSWSKSRLQDHVTGNLSDFLNVLEVKCQDYIVQSKLSVSFLIYLYFGKTYDDLKSFALRDLGILNTNKSSSSQARFQSIEEALLCFKSQKILDQLKNCSP